MAIFFFKLSIIKNMAFFVIMSKYISFYKPIKQSKIFFFRNSIYKMLTHSDRNQCLQSDLSFPKFQRSSGRCQRKLHRPAAIRSIFHLRWNMVWPDPVPWFGPMTGWLDFDKCVRLRRKYALRDCDLWIGKFSNRKSNLLLLLLTY